MRINIPRNRWLLPVGSMIAASVIVAVSWFAVATLRPETNVQETTVMSVHMNVYSTIEDLSEAADAVVLGTVKKVAATGIGRGKEREGTPIPYTLYEVAVLEELKGDVADTIYVSRTDPSFLAVALGFKDAPLTKLRKGETVVLYLYEMSTDVEPTITVTDTIYVPLSFDNGVFDVSSVNSSEAVGIVNDATEVHPRGVRLDMFSEGSVFTPADVRQAIQPDSGADGPVDSAN